MRNTMIVLMERPFTA
ncbi:MULTISPECIES: hypothetical protein [Caulobacter]